MMGHNDIQHRLEDAMGRISQANTDLRTAWIDYGKALNDLRGMYPEDDKGFGKAKANLLSQLDQVEKPYAKAEEAAMWAAANPDQVAQADALGGKHEVTVKGGFRGHHKAWKDAYEDQPDPAPKPDPKPKPKAKPLKERAQKLQDLIQKAGPEGVTHDDLCTLAHDTGVVPKKHFDQTLTAVLREQATLVAAPRLYISADFYDDGTTVEDLNKTGKEKYEALVRRHEKEYEWRVHQEAQAQSIAFIEEHQLKDLKNEIKHLQRLVSRRAKIISKDEMKALKLCVHPDANPSDEVKAKAFAALERMEDWAVDEAEPKREAAIGSVADKLRRAAEARKGL